MDSAYLQDHVNFPEDGPGRATVFETEHLWTQVLSLARNESIGPVSDPDADAILTVAAGEVVFQVDRSRKRMKQWGTVLVPAGAELTVTSASSDPSVVLIVTAPPPQPSA